jgi:hypothetical protein
LVRIGNNAAYAKGLFFFSRSCCFGKKSLGWKNRILFSKRRISWRRKFSSKKQCVCTEWIPRKTSSCHAYREDMRNGVFLLPSCWNLPECFTLVNQILRDEITRNSLPELAKSSKVCCLIRICNYSNPARYILWIITDLIDVVAAHIWLINIWLYTYGHASSPIYTKIKDFVTLELVIWSLLILLSYFNIAVASLKLN